MSLATGTKIGPYEIVGWLGAGGMGEVYRARDGRLGREVAIKLIAQTFATNATRVHRFEQEARAVGQLSHPNILAVYDVGTHAGTPYIVSELLEGESLRTRLHGGSIPVKKAIDYAKQIAEGLAAAHDKGIVHRDLKPDNLFILHDGRIKILDFGLAKLSQAGDPDSQPTALPTETEPGTVLGTVGYMSPEQVRGESLDPGSDLFSFGTILHEMLTGKAPFSRGSAADTMAAVLKEEPAEPLPPNTPPALARIIARCLEKNRGARFQSARDLAFALDVLSGASTTATVAQADATPRRWLPVALVGAIAISAALLAATCLMRRAAPAPFENPLENARLSKLTDWDGTELGAEISPDGRFVAFYADKAGEFDIWLTQVGTGEFRNLTAEAPALSPPGGVMRPLGFSGDGGELWYPTGGDAGGPKVLVPISGGKSRPFLAQGQVAPFWSPDGARLVMFNNRDGDPLYTADKGGGDAMTIATTDSSLFGKGQHNHNPIWQGPWIYFMHGAPTIAMDIWRIRPEGGSPERLMDAHAPANFLTALNDRTVLYVSRTEDLSGPWLWALDVETKTTRRVISGLEQYTSISASRDGRRAVASVSNPSSSLWTVPLLERVAEEGEVKPYPLPAARALSPRFAGAGMFFLSSRGSGDGLWRFQDQQAVEVGNRVEGTLPDAPVVSRDGSRVAVVVSRQGKRRLVVMAADGTNARTLTEAIEIRGTVGLGVADWSPDGAWIVASATDADGDGLFKIPVDGVNSGKPVRLVTGAADSPVWSPRDDLIVYSGTLSAGRMPLLGVTPSGTPVPLPDLRARINSGYRFLPDGSGVVFIPYGPVAERWNFWLLDLATRETRPLTRLTNPSMLRTFDVTPDGRAIVFDRTHENSNIYLIDFPK